MYSPDFYDAIKALGEEEQTRFCMPGHKGKNLPELGFLREIARYDFTELSKTDNLYAPEGILLSMMERLSGVFSSDISVPLAGGGSQGVKAMLYLAARRGKRMVFDRGCHRSAIEAAALCGIEPVFLAPGSIPGFSLPDGISPAALDALLTREKKISAVLLTSPNYFGVRSEIKALAGLCKKHGALLLVDDCHGAHFAFCGERGNAQALGADFSVVSPHKTLGALTGAAVLSYTGGEFKREELLAAAALFGSSSPSYLILASIDRTVADFFQNGAERLKILSERALAFQERISALPAEFLKERDLKYGTLDPGKITLNLGGCAVSAEELSRALCRERLYPEGVFGDNLLFLASAYTGEADFSRLAALLFKSLAGQKREKDREENAGEFYLPERAMTPREALFSGFSEIGIEDSEGEIAAEGVEMYPPGSLLLVPGERIDRRVVERFLRGRRGKIRVARENR